MLVLRKMVDKHVIRNIAQRGISHHIQSARKYKPRSESFFSIVNIIDYKLAIMFVNDANFCAHWNNDKTCKLIWSNRMLITIREYIMLLLIIKIKKRGKVIKNQDAG